MPSAWEKVDTSSKKLSLWSMPAEAPLDLLKKHFGFESFRGLQESVIQHVLSGKHALVLMPTGSGKSICYQLPALNLARGCLVISPLIALMQDQVESLRARGIAAAYINSSIPATERAANLQFFLEGKLKLLYVTPERFRKKAFGLQIAGRGVDLLAVDEAHCISQWGHDFRPDYSRLSEIRTLLGEPTTIALTATATPEVQADIKARLGLEDKQIKLFHQGIERPNLRLSVLEVFADEERLQILEAVLAKYRGPGIVYFALIQSLEKFKDLLDQRGIEATVYHGKLPTSERSRVQQRFMNGEQNLMLATNAFGMGVDKADIRFVLHAELPGSLEAYYQEIGRAGRDGADALALLLYDQQHLATQMEFNRWSRPEPRYYKKLYELLRDRRDKVLGLGVEYLRSELIYRNRSDFRLETALRMMQHYGVFQGSVQAADYQIQTGLPENLMDVEIYEKEVESRQARLSAMVDYFRARRCRRRSIHSYFGLTIPSDCGNCDYCLLRQAPE